MPVTLVLGSAAEVTSTYPAQVAPTHRAAEMTFAHHPKMTPAHHAAEVASITCKRAVATPALPTAMAATMIAILCNINLHSLERGLRNGPQMTVAARVAGARPPCSASTI
jgi:hypothetical protein